MGIWQKKPADGSLPFFDGLFDYMDSPEGELSGEVGDTVSSVLKHADVDTDNRRIVWEDSQRLSIVESAQRIHADYPDYPLDVIDRHVVMWLECDYNPPTYTPEQFDELDRLTAAWIEDHERQTAALEKAPRSPHS